MLFFCPFISVPYSDETPSHHIQIIFWPCGTSSLSILSTYHYIIITIWVNYRKCYDHVKHSCLKLDKFTKLLREAQTNQYASWKAIVRLSPSKKSILMYFLMWWILCAQCPFNVCAIILINSCIYSLILNNHISDNILTTMCTINIIIIHITIIIRITIIIMLFS